MISADTRVHSKAIDRVKRSAKKGDGPAPRSVTQLRRQIRSQRRASRRAEWAAEP
jgi:hypothetical protein